MTLVLKAINHTNQIVYLIFADYFLTLRSNHKYTQNMLDGLSLVLYIIKLQYKDHQETITCWRPIPFVTQSEQNIYPMSLQCNSDNKHIWFHLCPLMSIVRIQIQTTVDIWRFLLRCLVYKEEINSNAYADI